MYRLNNKQKGVTLIEIIIALFILSLVIFASLSSIGSLYKNAYDGSSITEDVYANKKDIEEMAFVIRSFAFEENSDMADLTREVDNTYDSVKASEIKDKLNKLNCNYVHDITLFDSSTSSSYSCKVDGFSMYSYSANSSDKIKKLHVFVPNSGSYIKYYRLQNAYVMDKKHANKKAKYNYVINSDSLGLYKTMLKETQKYAETLAYSKYEWQFAPMHYEDSTNPAENRIFEAVFDDNDKEPSLVDPDAVCSTDFGSAIESAIARSKYPNSDIYYKKWMGSANFAPNASYITEDGYLRCNVKLFYNFKYNGKNVTNEYTTQPVWLINLPYVNNMIYHYAMGLDGQYLDDTTRTTKQVDELSQILDDSYVNSGYNLKNSGSSDFTINSDGEYHFYKIPNSNENELSANTRGPSSSNGRNTMTLFVVVDFDDAESGTILQRKNSSDANKKYFSLDYDKSRNSIIFYSGPKNETEYYNKNKITFTPYTTGKHLIVLKVSREGIGNKLRRNHLIVDTKASNAQSIVMKKKGWISWKSDKRDDYNALNNNSKLLIGGAKGAKIYEIVGYSEVLSNGDVSKICKYLAKKYGMPDYY